MADTAPPAALEMPSRAQMSTTDDAPQDLAALHVLVTGYGPFSTFKANPSWLAVKPLHNTTLRTLDPSSRPIRITALQVPVTYASVLSLTPGFHAHPPVLPQPDNAVDNVAPSPTPQGGFDFILHVGVAGPGPMRVEKRGRKAGYNSPDAEGRLCATVSTEDGKDGDGRIVGAHSSWVARSELYSWASSQTAYLKPPMRGFGKGYEHFPDELFTEVDSEGLLQYLKETGFTRIVPSTDAGLYLCEFINYCSLAEAQRTALRYGDEKSTSTLFLHCPPVSQPLSTLEVTEVLQKIVSWVCSQMTATCDVYKCSSSNKYTMPA